MKLDPEHLIDSVAALREQIAPPSNKVSEKIYTRLLPDMADYIALSTLLMVATADAEGNLDVSPKGDQPGFVRLVDDRTLLIPERKGNRLAFGFHNILETGKIGLNFLIPGTRETLRVNGRAVLSRDPQLLEQAAADNSKALLVTVVTVEEAFIHCGKAMVRSGIWQSDSRSAEGEKLVRQHFSSSLGLSEKKVSEMLESDYKDQLY